MNDAKMDKDGHPTEGLSIGKWTSNRKIGRIGVVPILHEITWHFNMREKITGL
jgi:hypothetical protein